MDDLISRQEAIDAIRAMQTYKLFAGDDMLLIDQAGAQTELMLLPPAQLGTNLAEVGTDCISRQAAIKTVSEYGSVWMEYTLGMTKDEIAQRALNNAKATMIRIVKELPSAQPDIIRCKECKYSEHWYKDKRRCFLWHEAGIDVFEDGYCNYAERKDNG